MTRLRALLGLAVVIGALFAAPGPATAGWNDGHKCELGCSGK